VGGRRENGTLLENAGVAYMQGYFFGAPELAKSALRNEVAESTAV
jgi:EAL domain-containing protein (putative c-di-GMP-specific phosphodiesterase class I)